MPSGSAWIESTKVPIKLGLFLKHRVIDDPCTSDFWQSSVVDDDEYVGHSDTSTMRSISAYSTGGPREVHAQGA